MYKQKSIAVVVPAYNEHRLIEKTITTIPDFVDKIVVIDDCSKDDTVQLVKALIEKQTPDYRIGTPDINIATSTRIVLITHSTNQGVGGSISTGYKWCVEHEIDISVVMAGDAQMDPTDLPALLDPVAEDRADYSKGNRLITGQAWNIIPKDRYFGNAALSFLTKIASGYWHVGDSQTGYTAASIKALKSIDLDMIYKRYGAPNDLLVKMNIANMRVCDVKVKPVYGIGEKSGFKPVLMIPRLSWLITKLFLKRMVFKYIIRDFHPLVIFYLSGITLAAGGIAVGIWVLLRRLLVAAVQDLSPMFAVFLFISGWQFILFAMWFDMEYNKDLKA